MLIASIFVLFFLIDVLCVFHFYTIGMIPVDIIISSCGTIFVILIIRYRVEFSLQKQNTTLVIFFVFYLILFVLFRFVNSMYRIALMITKTDSFIYPYENSAILLLIIMSVVLIVILARDNKLETQVKRWIMVSIWISVVKLIIHFRLSIFSFLVYRYYGLLDFAVIFCWLLAIDNLMKLKYEHDISNTTTTIIS